MYELSVDEYSLISIRRIYFRRNPVDVGCVGAIFKNHHPLESINQRLNWPVYEMYVILEIPRGIGRLFPILHL